MAIRFYKINELHGYLSSFSRHPIELRGEVWPTSEHWKHIAETVR